MIVMDKESPISWVENPQARRGASGSMVSQFLPSELPHAIRRFYQQIPSFCMSLLNALPNLAASLGLGSIWIKDESSRFNFVLLPAYVVDLPEAHEESGRPTGEDR